MRICCLIKDVPGLGRALRIDPAGLRLDRRGPGAINPFDLNALEEALRIRRDVMSGGSTAEVIVVTMGPAEAERSLARALALGADSGLHVCDPALAGSDAAVTAAVLARAFEAAAPAPDLILAGQQSADGECCAVPAMVAAHMGLPVVTQVVAIAMADGDLHCRRQGDTGYESVRVEMPAMIGVSEGINRPSYPELSELIASRQKVLRRVSLADLGIDADRAGVTASLTEVLAIHPVATRREGRLIDGGDAAGAADEVIAWLEARELIS